MALISLKSRRDPIDVPNEKAKTVKNRWTGDFGMKAESSDIVDLGWITFSYGQIKSIEIVAERKQPDEDYNRPLTREEQSRADEQYARIRENLVGRGVLRPKVGQSHTATRCDDCKCVLKRNYVCRHGCRKCVSSHVTMLA